MKIKVLCALGIALIALALWFRPEEADDFAPFYRAATLASAHRSVYANPSWSPRTNSEGRFLPFLRIPSYAEALRPLTSLPYATARRIWIAILILAAIGSAALLPDTRGRFALAMAFSFPLANALMVGQDISLVLLIVLAAAWIYSSGREFAAGFLASLLCIKSTWVPAVGLAFLAKSRRATLGMATGAAIQLAASFAAGGAGWVSDYRAILGSPQLDLEPGRMLNLRAVVYSLSLPPLLYMLAALVLYVGFWFLCRRLNVADSLTIALALGLIAAPHCKVYDGVVLIPLFVRVASLKSWTGRLACFALTPVLYLLVLMGTPPLQLAGSALIVASAIAAALHLGNKASYLVGAGKPEGWKTAAVLSS